MSICEPSQHQFDANLIRHGQIRQDLDTIFNFLLSILSQEFTCEAHVHEVWGAAAPRPPTVSSGAPGPQSPPWGGLPPPESPRGDFMYMCKIPGAQVSVSAKATGPIPMTESQTTCTFTQLCLRLFVLSWRRLWHAWRTAPRKAQRQRQLQRGQAAPLGHMLLSSRRRRTHSIVTC